MAGIDFAAHAQERGIERVSPGWVVQTFDPEDGTPFWVDVHAVLHGTHRNDGRKITEVRGRDVATGELIAVCQFDNELITCCTKPEAARARKTAGQARGGR